MTLIVCVVYFGVDKQEKIVILFGQFIDLFLIIYVRMWKLCIENAGWTERNGEKECGRSSSSSRSRSTATMTTTTATIKHRLFDGTEILTHNDTRTQKCRTRYKKIYTEVVANNPRTKEKHWRFFCCWWKHTHTHRKESELWNVLKYRERKKERKKKSNNNTQTNSQRERAPPMNHYTKSTRAHEIKRNWEHAESGFSNHETTLCSEYWTIWITNNDIKRRKIHKPQKATATATVKQQQNYHQYHLIRIFLFNNKKIIIKQNSSSHNICVYWHECKKKCVVCLFVEETDDDENFQ